MQAENLEDSPPGENSSSRAENLEDACSIPSPGDDSSSRAENLEDACSPVRVKIPLIGLNT